MRQLAALCCVAWTFGCAGPTEPAPAPAGAPASEAPAAPTLKATGRLLPAFALPGERDRSLKTDWAQNPEWYAITVAPPPGFRAMQEWEPMQALLLTYAYDVEDSPEVAQSLADIAYWTIVEAQTSVWVIYNSSWAQQRLSQRLQNAGLSASAINEWVRWINLSHDSIWHIDYGPLPLVYPDGIVAFADFRYYPDRENDDAIPTRLGNLIEVSTFRMPLDMEGGNFQADGEGTCYTTYRLLEYVAESQTEVQDILRAYAGCETVVWLRDIGYTSGSVEDGTGHVDMFFKLTDVDAAIVGSYTTAQDRFAKADMDWNATQLTNRGLTVHRMPMPNIASSEWGPIPRTYLNSTLVNSVNLWPVYTADQSIQTAAESVWQQALPQYTHVGILSDEISLWSGAVHCVTRTVPVGTLAPTVPDGFCQGGYCQAVQGGYDGRCTSSAQCIGPAWLCATGNPYNCEFCEPDCAGKQCGDDGCGGACGFCPAGLDCDNGQCGECTPNCTGRQCGSDGCGGSCGTCPAGQSCDASGHCVACAPQCDDRQCGDDGCGGSCGACAAGSECNALFRCQPTSGCGDFTFEGCCEGDVTIWCDDGAIAILDCRSQHGTGCGWVASESYYYCGGSGSDPAGQLPIACPWSGCTPNCTGRECGSDGCGGSCGTCAAGEVCNASGQCGACVPNCAGRECGDNGCGGSCGTCGANEACIDAQCVSCTPDCTDRECGDDGCGGSCGECGAGFSCNVLFRCGPDEGCGNIPWEGCCVGSVAVWCTEQGELSARDCAAQGCGWTQQYGYFCGGSGTDPSGEFGITCDWGCLPDCTGRACGSDGCGGSCGSCPAGESCSAAGQCTSTCVPNCAGKECGSDGCDGSCGSCPAGESCSAAGQCTATCVPNCAGKECGSDGCDGSCGSCPAGESCSAAGQCTSACVPNCTGRECGADDCGGVCGVCGPGEQCNAGQCSTEPCVPDCTDRDCGSDGCAGNCGTCDAGETCVAGQCSSEPCQPACAGLECGPDGCGGVCGVCGPGETCDGGQCTSEPCVPDCTGRICGDDGCGGSCGSCPAGLFCVQGRCNTDCVPDCTGRICGDDGCGGSCGSCPAGLFCVQGRCNTDCVPDCTGRECGDNGCGGSCGTCALDKLCQDGTCVAACTPQCAGRQCGPDGCGGACGVCNAGQTCSAEGLCAGGATDDTIGADGTPDVPSPGDVGNDEPHSGGGGGCNAAAGALPGLAALFALIGLAGLRRRKHRLA